MRYNKILNYRLEELDFLAKNNSYDNTIFSLFRDMLYILRRDGKIAMYNLPFELRKKIKPIISHRLSHLKNLYNEPYSLSNKESLEERINFLQELDITLVV